MTHHAQARNRGLEITIPGADARPRIHHGGRWIILDDQDSASPTRGLLTVSASRASAHHSLARAIAEDRLRGV